MTAEKWIGLVGMVLISTTTTVVTYRVLGPLGAILLLNLLLQVHAFGVVHQREGE